MVRSLALLGVLLSAAACFGPSYPVGLACSERGECPGDQICVDAVCVVPQGGSAADASPGEDDDGGDGGGAVDAGVEPCMAIADDDVTCNGADDDCDGAFDEDAGAENVYYRDRDGDGHGGDALVSCERPDGTVLVAGDCWDSTDPEAAFANPDQTEPRAGAMESSTTGLLHDWDCDGVIVHESISCILGCELDDRCQYDYNGWDVRFAECGETLPWCVEWEEYEDYCVVDEDRTQRCR